MAEQRGRRRVPLQGVGAGRIGGSGKRFEFKVEDFSIDGLLLHMVKGTVPGLGEQVGLAVRVDRLEGGHSQFAITGTVKRHQKNRNRILCGIEVDSVKGDAGAQESMNQTYLEQLFADF